MNIAPPLWVTHNIFSLKILKSEYGGRESEDETEWLEIETEKKAQGGEK